jgi:hypothetical protein
MEANAGVCDAAASIAHFLDPENTSQLKNLV